jgi:8-oxo-dGTP diphosphatase
LSPRPVVEVAVGVLIDAAGAILLGQRPVGKPYAGYWEFPGGKVDDGENEYEALIREFKEEFGIEIQPFHQFKSAVNDTVELIPFICNYVSGKAIKRVLWVRWFR